MALYLSTFLLPSEYFIGMVALLCSVVGYLLTPRRYSSKSRLIGVLFVSFVFCRFVSAYLFGLHHEAVLLTRPMLDALIVFLIVSNLFSEGDFADLFVPVIYASALLIFYLLYCVFEAQDPQQAISRSGLRLVVPNDIVVFPILGMAASRYVDRRYSVVLLVLSFTLGISFSSRLTVLVSSFGLLAVLYLHYGLGRISISVLLGSALFGLFVGLDTVIEKSNVGISQRVVMWELGWEMFLQGDSALLGSGPGGFSVEYAKVADRIHFPDPRQAQWAHNAFLESLIEQGIVGFILLSALLLLLLNRLRLYLMDWVAFSCLLFVMFVEASLLRIWFATAFALVVAVQAQVVTENELDPK